MEEVRFYVAGTKFHQMNEVLDKLAVGDEFELVPEPDNKFDPNAIRLEVEGLMMGYVPKKFSAKVSAMIDADILTSCFIVNVNPKAPSWEWCEVVVKVPEEYLEEYSDDDEEIYTDDEDDLEYDRGNE